MRQKLPSIFKFIKLCTCSAILAMSHLSPGQSPSLDLNQNYISSPRAAAMSSAISTTANGVDSAFYNPAATGGIFWKSSPPAVRQLQFPFIGGTMSKPALELRESLNSAGASTDPAAGEAILSENKDTRYYGRLSLGLYIEYTRASFLVFSDTQFAGFNSSEDLVDAETGSQVLTLSQASTSGYGFGLSGSAFSGNLYGGVFIASISREYFEGNITYDELVTSSKRSKVISENSNQYDGMGLNGGILWRIADTARPVLALVGRNIGNTELSSGFFDASTGSGESALSIDQELVLGFSVTPAVAGGEFNLALDYVHKNSNFNPAYGLKMGGEYAVGGVANEALFALRFGYSAAGTSFGFKLGSGLINLEASSSPIMVNKGLTYEPEVQNSIIFNINARDM